MDELKLKQEVAAMSDMCNIALRIFEERNAQYGGAYEFTGVVGASAELLGNIARLQQLVFKASPEALQDPHHVKQLQDCFRDIHNYSGIAAIMLSRMNWSGKEQEWSPIIIFTGEEEELDV